MESELTDEQKKAIKRIPFCVDLEGMDGTWRHYVFRVEHVVDLWNAGEHTYTRRDKKSCQRWLDRYAPESEYSSKSC